MEWVLAALATVNAVFMVLGCAEGRKVRPVVNAVAVVMCLLAYNIETDRNEPTPPEPISSSISEPAPWAGKSITARYQRLAGAIPPPEWSVLNENAGSWAFSEVAEDSGTTLEQAPESAPAAEVRPTPVPTVILIPTTEGAHLAGLTRDDVRAMARAAGWAEGHIETVVRVAECESKLRPWEVGAAGELGLMQIHPVHVGLHAKYDLRDPVQNLQAALEVFAAQGWPAWSCS